MTLRDPVLLLPPLTRQFTREEALRELEKLYAQLPKLACRGRCHDSCTVVVASELEHQRIAAAGATLGAPVTGNRLLDVYLAEKTPRCPALGPLNNCTIYSLRPFICRLYGAAEGLRCPHGCVPERILPDTEAHALIAKIEQLSRHVTGVQSWPPETAEDDPETGDRIDALVEELRILETRRRVPLEHLESPSPLVQRPRRRVPRRRR